MRGEDFVGKVKFKSGDSESGSRFSALREDQFWVCTRCGIKVVAKKCPSCSFLKKSRSNRQKGMDQKKLWDEYSNRKDRRNEKK